MSRWLQGLPDIIPSSATIERTKLPPLSTQLLPETCLAAFLFQAQVDYSLGTFMITIEIPLQDIIVDIKQNVDLSTVSEEEAIPLIVQAYQFLPQPLRVHINGRSITIQSPANSQPNKKTTRLFDRAAANRGRCEQTLNKDMDLQATYELALKMHESQG